MILGDIQSSHTKKWVEGICNSGIEVGVFSLREPKDEWVKQLANLTVFLPKKKSSLLGKIGYLGQVKTVRHYITVFQPDIIHSHYATSYGLLGALNKVKPFFVSVWGSDIFEFPKKSLLHKMLLKFILRKADAIFSSSNIMAEEAKKYTQQNITVIPFGVDTEVFVPQQKHKQDKQIVGTVKTLEHIYGIDRLIASCIVLKPDFPNLECHIYGQGSLRNMFEKTIQENNAENYIFLKGAIPHNQVPAIMSQMDIFCNFSREESFGVAVLEASSCGVPVVATNVGGLKEVVADKKTGFLAEENTTDLTEKIRQLLQNEQLRHEMGKAGRKWVLENYAWQENLKTMISFYRQ